MREERSGMIPKAQKRRFNGNPCWKLDGYHSLHVITAADALAKDGRVVVLPPSLLSRSPASR